MANNRMYIRCLKCGEEKMIAKYYPSSGWYMECIPEKPKKYPLNKINMVEQLERCFDDTRKGSKPAFDAFLEKHRHQDNQNFSDGGEHFSITFEGDQCGDALSRGLCLEALLKKDKEANSAKIRLES